MKGNNWNLANKIFDVLNSEGAGLGEYSLVLIEQVLDSELQINKSKEIGEK